MRDWKTYKLGALADFGDGAHSKVNRVDNGILYLTSKNFKEGKLKLDNIDFITENDYNQLFSTKSKAVNRPTDGDVLLGIIGTLGNAYLYKENDRFGISSSVAIIRPDNINLNSKYLYYYITGKKFKHFQSAHNGASVQGYTNLPPLRTIPIKIPQSIDEQKAIASILSALDDKIELNLQMNKTLEELAMALYKHWFVDFGPFQDGKFIETDLGMIPEGWEVKKIGDSVETLGGGTPSTIKNEFWESGEILWYSPTDLTKEKSLFSFDTAKKITQLGLQKSSAKMFPEISLLMSSRATIGLITINTKPACTNQGFITMLPNERLSVYQLYFWVRQNEELIISKSNGSTFKEISKSNFRDLNVIIGTDVDPYLKETKDLFNQIQSNLEENQTLTTLRETLLPKLLSGEVRVKDIEQVVVEAL